MIKVGNAAQYQPLAGFARSKGFTLIEVLIALAITAFVATIAYTSLSAVISGVESTREAATKTYEVDRALMIVSRDIRQFVARPIRDEFGQLEPALSGGTLARFMLSFTRSGWHNPRHYPRSNLQRINYLVEDDALWRESYLVLDRVGDTQPRRVKLLDGVLEMSVGFLGTYSQVEAGNDGKAQIERADILVVGRHQPADPEARLVIVVRVVVGRIVSHGSASPSHYSLRSARRAGCSGWYRNRRWPLPPPTA